MGRPSAAEPSPFGETIAIVRTIARSALRPAVFDGGVATPRIALLAVLGLAACSAPIHLAPPRAGPPELRVMTLNFRNVLLDPNDPRARLRRVAEAIETHRPHLVALQEIVVTPAQENGAASLAAATGYRWRWHATHGHPLVALEGPALLARGRIAAFEVRPLPHRDLDGLARRAVLGARVATPLGEVAFYATHMTVDEDETVKADQAAALARFVAERPDGLPAVVAGDLNAEPHTRAMRVLRGNVEHDGARGDLADAWLTTHPVEEGGTFPANAPSRRIDYVMSAAGARVDLVAKECRRILDDPEAEAFASDHVALLCTLVPRAPSEL